MARIVIDANIAIALAVQLPYSEQAVARMMAWQQQGDELYAPTLWTYEIVSALRKVVAARVMTTDGAVERLQQLLSLQVEIIAPSADQHRLALTWAEWLNQSVAYDAQYLALAEFLGAAFWTADSRLAHGAKQAGASWVHHLSE